MSNSTRCVVVKVGETLPEKSRPFMLRPDHNDRWCVIRKNHGELADLIEGISFGVAVFVIPSGRESDLRARLTWRSTDILVGAARYRAGLPVPEGRIDLDEALALACLICQRGGAALLAIEGGDVSPLGDGESSHPRLNDPRVAESFCLKVAAVSAEALVGKWDERFWGILNTLALRHRTGLRRARLGFDPPANAEKRRFGRWELGVSEECQHWVEVEFTRRDQRREFDQLAAGLATRLGESELRMRCQLVAAIRLASFLAFRKIEGIEFDTILVLPLDGEDSLDTWSIRVAYTVGDLWLDFEYENDLATLLEMAQGAPLFLAVDPEDCRVIGIHAIKPGISSQATSHTEGTRQWLDRLVTQQRLCAIRLGRGGRTEVFVDANLGRAAGEHCGAGDQDSGKAETKSGKLEEKATDSAQGEDSRQVGTSAEKFTSCGASLVLHCDGPEWRAAPFAELVKRLNSHWPGPEFETTRTILTGALMRLLDQERSCILALLPDDEKKVIEYSAKLRLNREKSSEKSARKYERQFERRLRSLGLEEMRPGLCLIDDPLFEVLGVKGLASWLSLDGAHVVTSRGQIIAMELRVLGGESGSQRGVGGSGHAAMRVLAKNLSDALIVKVSAGGTISYDSR